MHFAPADPSELPAIAALVNSAYRGESSRQGWTTEADYLGGQRTDAQTLASDLAANPQAGIATLAEPIEDVQALFNPNVVKVVSDINGLALTFSRSTLPWARDEFAKQRDVLPAGVPYRRHIGIYAYRAGFLHDFVNWGPCWLENTEALEQLRALWHGVRIHVDDAMEAPPAGVDTPEDLERVRRLLGA